MEQRQRKEPKAQEESVKIEFKNELGFGKMKKPGKALVMKNWGPEFDPGTHTKVEGENRLYKVSFL